MIQEKEVLISEGEEGGVPKKLGFSYGKSRFKSVSKRWNQVISDPYFNRCYSCRCNHPHKNFLWAKHYSGSYRGSHHQTSNHPSDHTVREDLT
ncbi:hypothetical protein VNO77_01217 [Canavalia gladiata]|uniref:Uncharacterized protein n=1 Tax=Canavalia gladiata TaxID=3824 RepID=A0AAN9MR02_CANGL